MGNAAAKRSQQQAAFIGAFEKLVPELERNGFIETLIKEAKNPEWYVRTERSSTATLKFMVLKGEFVAITMTFANPGLMKLDVNTYQKVVFGEDHVGELLLSDEQCDALFEAFLDECRRFFQRHKIRLSPSGRRFFLPK
ncbi:MAG TPA: hypothetical protein VFZ48_05865 [Candidatus Saccharimonadales bacterium]